MITYLIIKSLFFLAGFPLAVVDVLGNSMLPEGVATSLVTVTQMGMALEPIFPVVLLYTLVTMIVSFEIWVMWYKGGMWIFDMVRKTIRG